MLTIKTTLKEIPGKGIGLFTEEDLIEGQVWWKFDVKLDKIIFKHEFSILDKLTQDFVLKYSVKDVSGDHWLDTDNGKFCNHSDTPNSEGTDFTYGVSLKVKTIRPIKAGEELTMDYREFIYDYPDGILNFKINE